MLYMGWLLILDPKLFKCLLYRLDETAIPEWHEGFLQDCPSGKLKLETFLCIAGGMIEGYWLWKTGMTRHSKNFRISK